MACCFDTYFGNNRIFCHSVYCKEGIMGIKEKVDITVFELASVSIFSGTLLRFQDVNISILGTGVCIIVMFLFGRNKNSLIWRKVRI